MKYIVSEEHLVQHRHNFSRSSVARNNQLDIICRKSSIPRCFSLYYYDLSNQLTRENNLLQNETLAYTYDAKGNIITKTIYPYTTGNLNSVAATYTYSYQYGDAADKDRLINYDGKVVTYATDGNVKTYEGKTFIWSAGQLSNILSSGNAISYQYNSDGYRTEKIVNGVATAYVLNGDQILSETNGVDTINYYYSSSGSPVYMTIKGIA